MFASQGGLQGFTQHTGLEPKIQESGAGDFHFLTPRRDVESGDNIGGQLARIEFPRLGKSVVEIGEENVREINLYSYRIMYEVMPDIIYIHGVIHMRRNFKPEDLER